MILHDTQNHATVIRIIFSLIGKFLIFVSMVFGTLYSLNVKVFPINVRGMLMGFCSTTGRIGGVIAPYLSDAVRAFQINRLQ